MGGHGGLNILPQKRWNVYNYENRATVNRDQQMVREEREHRERLQRAKRLQDQIRLAKGEGLPEEEAAENSRTREETKHDRYAEENELYVKAKRKQKQKEVAARSKIMSTAMKPLPDDKHVNLFVHEELNERLKHDEGATEHPVMVSIYFFEFLAEKDEKNEHHK